MFRGFRATKRPDNEPARHWFKIKNGQASLAVSDESSQGAEDRHEGGHHFDAVGSGTGLSDSVRR